jgi:hypothetical protein
MQGSDVDIIFDYGLLIAILIVAASAPVVGVAAGQSHSAGSVDSGQATDGANGSGIAAPNGTVGFENGTGTSNPQPATASVIQESFTVDRTPGDVGRVTVTYEVTAPDTVRSISVGLANDTDVALSVVSSSNFTYDASADRWEHSSAFGSETAGTLTYVVETNTTAGNFGGYETVETAGWAYVGSPQLNRALGYVYSTSQPEPVVHSKYSTAGEGYGASGDVFMGPHATERASGANQTFTVVFPDAAAPRDATLTASNAAGSLTAAAAVFDVGDRDPEVTAFVLPEPIRGGGRGGGDSFWVGATTNRPFETLLHEYVHTRQAWTDGDLPPNRLAADTEWFTEASADYYGGYLAWQQGYLSDAAFQDYLSEETDGYADSVLQDADRVETESKNYYKGRRVLGALDLRIRKHTGGDESLLGVLRRINGMDNESVFYRDLRGDVVAVTNESTGNWLDTYVGTTAAPSIPTDIAAAYDVTPDSDSAGPLRVRDVTVDPNATSANTTVTHQVSFRVTNVSDDNETDYGGVIVPVGELVDGSVSVTGGEDGTLAVVEGPEVGAILQESNDTLAFGINPAHADNASVVSVDATLTVRYPAANESTGGPVIAAFNDSTPRAANATTGLTVGSGGTPAGLSVTVSPGTVTVGESTTVTVSVLDTATGIPVENATVGLARSDTVVLSRTNATGAAAFAVNASSAGPIDVTVGLNGVTTTLATVNVTNTTDHESGVTQRLFDAVAGSDGTLERTDVIAAVSAYIGDGSVDGVEITRSDVLKLVRYYISG